MQFLKELLISATSGLFGRLLLVLMSVGGGFTVGAVVTSGSSTMTTIMLLTTFNFAVTCSLIGFFRNLTIFKEWAREQRQDEVRKLELGNEQQKLKNEGLKLEKGVLELRQENQQSTPDNQE